MGHYRPFHRRCRGGCNKEQSNSQEMDKVQTKTKQAAQDMKDYTFAQKDEFVKAMPVQWDALNKDLAQLSTKIKCCARE